MLYVRTETRPSKHLHNLALSQEEVNTQQNQTLNLSNPASAIMGYYLFVENARIVTTPDAGFENPASCFINKDLVCEFAVLLANAS